MSRARKPEPALHASAPVSVPTSSSDIGYISMNPSEDKAVKRKSSMDHNAHSKTLISWLVPLSMMVVCPLLLVYVWMMCTAYQCKPSLMINDFMKGEAVTQKLVAPLVAAYHNGKVLTVEGASTYMVFAVVQAVSALPQRDLCVCLRSLPLLIAQLC